ncbi:class I adenylate-forming enzyme family protein [Actinokineospora spheciospongiae]|uniref:class I adenylate-forming enzyme family protein n=1 Tax=Actinokineospora spheciospongiae TaxID=909613 RepID=UPI000D70AFD8|nr:AMP-binding protein [Actinokineospora spheciospongiae]PWW53018.1 amino acid adenylation domain-containing protein [Actinokineospora spheciospongiae]
MTNVVLSAPEAVESPGSVADLLTEAAAVAGGRPAVSDGGGTHTYAELDAISRTAANWLRRNGITRGDRVLLRLGNTREFVALLYGAFRAGAVVVPINPTMRQYHLAQVVADAEPALVVAAGTDTAAAASTRGTAATLVPAETVLAGAEGADEPFAEVGPDDLALLIYTSGSTSAPKGVVCPHGRVRFAAAAIAARLGYRADDVVLTASPLSFDYGLYQVFLSALARAELRVADAEDPVALMATLRASRATVVPIVPSLADMLTRLARRGAPPVDVRLFTNTGAALTAPTTAGLRATFPNAGVVPMYGITECKRVCILDADGDLAKPGSVGPALPGTRVLILDSDGAELPVGEVGEIVAEGPHVMAGYWRAPELTAQRFRTDPDTGAARLFTGDYGWLDADGHLYFAGRRDDQFKRHGTRMSAIEIEAAAVDVPGVDAAALLPPDGTRDMVLVVTGAVEPEAVLSGLAERLERAKVPPVCAVRDRLPLTPNGKTDKKALLSDWEGAANGD